MKFPQEFTLGFLLTTVTIIGILAAVGLPAYNDSTIRAKMSEAVLAASVCRMQISEVYQAGGSAPGAGEWGCEANASKYVASITTDANGAVTVTVRNVGAGVDNKKVLLSPFIKGVAADASTMMGEGINEWRCGPASSDGVSPKYLPSTCRSS